MHDVIIRHLLFNFFGNVSLYSYEGVPPHQVWFNLDQGKQSYGGGGGNSPPLQVENVLNRPGEIGLVFKIRNFKGTLCNFTKYIFAHIPEKSKCFAKQITNSYSPDYI